MSLFIPNTPDKEQVTLRLMDEHVTLTNWTSYQVHSHFLHPAGSFAFEVGDGNLPPRTREALRVGARVRLTLNSAILLDGHIDSIEIKAERNSGVVYEVCGRDRMALAVDAMADPTKHFKEGMTLLDAMKELLADFGWRGDDSFVIDNAANRDLKTGALRGKKSSKGKKTFGRPLKKVELHQLKPHPREGVYAFAARICERFGLHIWSYADGEKVVLGKPDFDQEPLFQIRRSASGDTNLLSGHAHFSMLEQPSVIIADGFSSSAEFGNSYLKSACVNPYFGVQQNGQDLPEVTAFLAKHPTAHRVEMDVDPGPQRPPNLPMRVLYLHDDESKTQEQLNNFVKREMSLLMRKSLVYNAKMEGSGQMIGDQFSAFGTDCVVDVRDSVAGVSERMWIIGCNYYKSRSGGTHTDLELVRLNSIQF